MVETSALEKHLKDQYIPIFRKMMRMSAAQARKTFKDLYKKITEEAEAEDTLNLPRNLGDRLLERESADKKVKKVLSKKRTEAIRDEDIRWWWNMHDLERRIMSKVDEVFIYTLFLRFTKEEKLSPKQTNEKIRKVRPMFGNPDDIRFGKGEDRPLPDELRQRVNTYIAKRAQKDPEGLKRDAEASTSYNAFIRKEIKAGNV